MNMLQVNPFPASTFTSADPRLFLKPSNLNASGFLKFAPDKKDRFEAVQCSCRFERIAMLDLNAPVRGILPLMKRGAGGLELVSNISARYASPPKDPFLETADRLYVAQGMTIPTRKAMEYFKEGDVKKMVSTLKGHTGVKIVDKADDLSCKKSNSILSYIQGGSEIPMGVWFPKDSSRGVVILSHGMGDKPGDLKCIKDAMIAEGFTVAVYPKRGHAGSIQGQKGHIKSMLQMMLDLDAIVLALNSLFSEQKIAIFDHSMGGLVTLEYLANLVQHSEKGVPFSPVTGQALPLAGYQVQAPWSQLRVRPTKNKEAIGRSINLVAGRFAMLWRSPSEHKKENKKLSDRVITVRTFTQCDGFGQKLKEVAPLLGYLPGRICHSPKDRVIRYEASQELVNAMRDGGNHRVSFLTTPGGHTPFRFDEDSLNSKKNEQAEQVSAVYAKYMQELFINSGDRVKLELNQ